MNRETAAMMGRKKVVPLGEIVDFNPRFAKDELSDDSLASFIPMKCVEEESGRFQPLGDRKVAEVRKGYTPFRDGDVIFAKVTPCMENGKAAVLKGVNSTLKCNVIVVEEYLARRQVAESFSGPVV